MPETSALERVPKAGLCRPYLSVVGGNDVGLTADLDEAVVTVGRGEDCSIWLDDRTVSRVHCRIEPGEGGYVVVDCKSSNGIFVNGERADRRRLSPGDKIRVGDTILVFLNGGQVFDDTPLSCPRIDPAVAVPFEPEASARSLKTVLGFCLRRVRLDLGARRVGIFVLEENEVPWPMAADAAEGTPPGSDSWTIAVDWVQAHAERYFAEGPAPAGAVLGVPIESAGAVVGAVCAEAAGPFARSRDEATTLLREFGVALTGAVEAAGARRRRQAGLQRAERAVVESTRMLGVPKSFGDLRGQSGPMERVIRLLPKVAATDAPVLIEGETGTGKELVARAIHTQGSRREGPFVAENCAAIASSLMESELFGHVKGAFTGAERDKAGLFELAHDGTLFLDEIADMSEELQKKLLRAIQEGVVRRVGGSDPVSVNVRIVAASNRPLGDLVKAGRFREDLYFRLNVLRVALPPLRERPEDVWPLAEHFLNDLAVHQGSRKKLSQDAIQVLLGYSWPGNVRELRNVVERAVLLGDGDVITAADLGLLLQATPLPEPGRLDFKAAKNKVVESFERRFLVEAMVRHRGNISAAADELRLERAHLYTLLKKCRLDAGRFRA